MLINATQQEEVRIALIDDRVLLDLDIEQRVNENKKSNIYIGKISRIESSLEACFVDYGEGRDGFLPFKDIHESYYLNKSPEIKDRLEVGQKLIVQVAREERGNKGAALTTYIAIASTFLVLMPNSPDVDGISRRLNSGDRDNLRNKLAELDVGPNEGLIVRTAGVGCSTEELKYDLQILHFIWDRIREYAEENDEVGILHHESETIIRVIRDYLTKDVDAIVVDSQEAYDKVNHYLKLVRPKSRPQLEHYRADKNKNIGLFAAYDIERQIDTAFERTVKLKSGGAIVIDTTEALTAIDVNSSRFTQGGDIESTALVTNLEAAEEIARQLKIRDLGGLIVIDFIDMSLSSNQKKVEDKMRQVTADDRARIQTSRISKFGLMEVSRQRIRGSIAESNNHVCPRCSGTGFIRDNESLSLHIIRQITEEAARRTGRLAKLHILVPNEIAAYLLNEKREDISKIEQINNVNVVIVPDASLQTPHFSIHRVRRGDQVKDKTSYHIVEYYQEQDRINHRKHSNKDKEEGRTLLHNLSSVPDAHLDKTFEARLEKAEFIKDALAREEQEKTLFGRFKRWLSNIFSSKATEDSKENAEDAKDPARKKRRTRRRSTPAPAPDIVTDHKPALESEKSEKTESNEAPLSKRAQRKLKREKEREAIVKAEDSKECKKVTNNSKVKETLTEEKTKAKVLTDGVVTEEVFSSKQERRKKSKKAQERITDEINPHEIKAQVEAQEKSQEKVQEKTQDKSLDKDAEKTQVITQDKVQSDNQNKNNSTSENKVVTKGEKANLNNKEEQSAKGETIKVDKTAAQEKTTQAVIEETKETAEKNLDKVSRKDKRKRFYEIAESFIFRVNQEKKVDSIIDWIPEKSYLEKIAPERVEVLATNTPGATFMRDIAGNMYDGEAPIHVIDAAELEEYTKSQLLASKVIVSRQPTETIKPVKVVEKVESTPNESTQPHNLRRYIFKSPQPCVNFPCDYDNVNRMKKAARLQQAKSEVKKQASEDKDNKKGYSSGNSQTRSKDKVNVSGNGGKNINSVSKETKVADTKVTVKPLLSRSIEQIKSSNTLNSSSLGIDLDLPQINSEANSSELVTDLAIPEIVKTEKVKKLVFPKFNKHQEKIIELDLAALILLSLERNGQLIEYTTDVLKIANTEYNISELNKIFTPTEITNQYFVSDTGIKLKIAAYLPLFIAQLGNVEGLNNIQNQVETIANEYNAFILARSGNKPDNRVFNNFLWLVKALKDINLYLFMYYHKLVSRVPGFNFDLKPFLPSQVFLNQNLAKNFVQIEDLSNIDFDYEILYQCDVTKGMALVFATLYKQIPEVYTSVYTETFVSVDLPFYKVVDNRAYREFFSNNIVGTLLSLLSNARTIDDCKESTLDAAAAIAGFNQLDSDYTPFYTGTSH